MIFLIGIFLALHLPSNVWPVVQIKDVLVGFITNYSRVYNIGYGKIIKKEGSKNHEMSINE